MRQRVTLCIQASYQTCDNGEAGGGGGGGGEGGTLLRGNIISIRGKLK